MKRLIFLMAILGTFSVPAFAGAATLSFAADQTTIGIDNPFEVAVMLDTENEVNAVGIAISIPSGFELVNTSNGNSIVNFWVEQPNYDHETHILTFSGIIPNGYSGTGQLLKLILKADAPGTVQLSFDSSRTVLYQNGPNGVPESVTSVPLTLRAVTGTTSIPISPADVMPPEAFVPQVTRSPQLYDNAWALVFATQDKGSGIAYYEVSESPVRVADPNTLSWTRAESPYRLTDQERGSYVYVRAIDEQGNIRTELYTPSLFPWFGALELGILIVVLVLFYIFWWRTKKRPHASL